MNPMAHSQLYTGKSAILTAKQWASFRQYQASKVSGHLYVGNVMLGRAVVVVVVRIVVVVVSGAWVGGRAVPDIDDEIDGLGLGTVRLEQASLRRGYAKQLTITTASNILECISKFVSDF